MATLEQCALAVATNGQNVHYHMRAEPGTGKTSILPLVAAQHGDAWRKVGDHYPEDKYCYIYFDCPTKDIIDMGLPQADSATGTASYAMFDVWQFNDPRPKVVMLDEVSKLPNIMKPVVTRIILEHMVGDRALAAGSKTFSNGNNASDGVGDSMQGHVNNRITELQVWKPTAEAWITWGIDNGVHELVLAAVHQFPHVMQSYLDDQNGDNPYIFNPKRNTGAFASPRSLYKASSICAKRALYGVDFTQEQLAGTVGVSFAGDMMAYIAVADTVPTWEAIKKSPEKTPVPDSPAAQLLLVFGSIGLVNKDNAQAFTEYFFRFETEVKMLWARQFKNRLEHVMGVKKFREGLVADHWIFG